MGHISLVVAAGVFALFGWGWFQHFTEWVAGNFMHAPARQEQRMQEVGTVKSETVHVDAEFDSELNAMGQEMDSIDASGDADLKALEQEQ